VGSCCGLVSVRRLVVIFGGAIMWTLWHGVSPLCLDAASRRAESSLLSAHPSAIHGKNSARNIVTGR
jgi:hypothetical protein